MKSNELKKLREEIGVRQKDISEILGVPVRTYINWEQEEGKAEHRKIPPQYAERLETLAGLKKNASGDVLPRDLVWVQLPFRPDEVKELKRRAEILEKNVALLLREKVFELFDESLIEPK